MKIKNDYVKIITGGKTYEFKNKILDEYLHVIAEAFVGKETPPEGPSFPALTRCFVRFDRKLYFDETSEIGVEDFDFGFSGSVTIEDIQKDKVVINYSYEDNAIPNYQNRQITAIGFFASSEAITDKCCACIDTFGFGLKTGEDIQITRQDVLQTEVPIDIFGGQDNVEGLPGPIHLLPTLYNWKENNIYSYLWMVSLGTKRDILNPFFIREYTSRVEDNKIIIYNNSQLKNEHVFNILEPVYKTPSSSLYPTNIGKAYDYIYLIYTVEKTTSPHQLGVYYIGLPIEIVGESFEYAISFERSDD